MTTPQAVERLKADLQQHAHHSVGSIRIDVAELRLIVLCLTAYEQQRMAINRYLDAMRVRQTKGILNTTQDEDHEYRRSLALLRQALSQGEG